MTLATAKISAKPSPRERSNLTYQFVYLAGSQALIAARMAARTGHYMPTTLLDSQFAALEIPGLDEAVRISIDQPLEGVVADVLGLVLNA